MPRSGGGRAERAKKAGSGIEKAPGGAYRWRLIEGVWNRGEDRAVDRGKVLL